LDLQIKSYGEIKLLGEIWAGQASARANHQEFTTSAQNVGSMNKEVWKSPLRVSSLVFWTLFLHLGGWIFPFLMELGISFYFNFLAKIRVRQPLGFLSNAKVNSLVQWKFFVPFLSAMCIWVCSTHPLPLRFST
jgi:hypothetical protein